MTTYFAGAGLDAFVTSAAAPPSDNGDSIIVSGAGWADGVCMSPTTGLPVAPTELWTHVRDNPDSGVYDGGRYPFQWFNSAGLVFLRADGNGRGLYFERWNGGGYTSIGNFPNLYGGVLDVYIKVHPTAGAIRIYWNSVALIELNGIDTSNFVNVAKLRIQGCSGYGYQPFYDVILASYSTIGHTVRRRRPVAAGSAADWSGAYGNLADGDDTTVISTTDVGKTSTFAGTNLTPTVAGSIVKAVVLAARLRNDGSGAGAQNALPVIRSGAGVAYSPAQGLPVGQGYAGGVAVYDKSPVTGSAWTIAEIDACEFGLKSAGA